MAVAISVDLVRAARRSPSFPKGWSDEELEREVGRYKRFLQLAGENPDRPLAPTKRIDDIWHLHMLSPRAYAEDCGRLFGDLLDHDGGFGADPAELPELKAAFEATAALWERTFHEPYVAVGDDPRITNCWHDCQSRCWHACKSK